MLAEIFGMDGIIVVIVVVAVLFGGSQIPKLAHSLGSARKEFKKGLEEDATAPARISLPDGAVVKVDTTPKT